MSDFFKPPPESEPEPDQRYRMPAWLGPPRGTLAGIAAQELVVARTERVAVCVGRIGAYPTGFELDIVVVSDPEQEDVDPMLFEFRHRRTSGRRALPPELLRLGVQFADGRRATTTEGVAFPSGPKPPTGPVMTLGGGGGGAGAWTASVWVWPLPPPGPLRFVCEWPDQDIALEHIEIDAQIILDAADRAQVLFSDAHLPAWTADSDDDDHPEVAIIR